MKELVKAFRAFELAADVVDSPPMRNACEWADANRILPPESAEPGPWRSARTPYVVPIAEAMLNPGYEMIVMVMGAQMGKTEFLLNLKGHILDDDPGPILFVCPTEVLARSISNDRLKKMVEGVPSLKAKMATGHNDKVIERDFGGTKLRFGWAGSATQLASHPCMYVFLDERDRMVGDVKGEGDPLALAKARTYTYPGSKIVATSTPTLAGNSPIWDLFLQGTQFRWAWPCPECGEYFVPHSDVLKYDDTQDIEEIRRNAYLECPACGYHVTEVDSNRCNQAGAFLAPGQTLKVGGQVEGEVPENATASFWVSGLCSPFAPFGSRAADLETAKRVTSVGRESAVKTVINTAFGETYELRGTAPNWEIVRALQSNYEMGDVPPGVRRLTAGVDVQGDRLVYVVRGWGENAESWLIEAGEFWGDTTQKDVWATLSGLLTKDFSGHRIAVMLVDAAYKPGGKYAPTNAVYDFSRKHPGKVHPTRGHARLDKPVKAVKQEVGRSGRVDKRGITLWHFDTDVWKSWVHGRIQWPVGESGAWHVPSGISDDYCKQVVSEERVAKPNGQAEWIRVRKNNHFFDAEVLNAVASDILSVQYMKPKQKKPVVKRTRGRKAQKTTTEVGTNTFIG